MTYNNLLRLALGTFCYILISTASSANDCESFAYTKNNVHICDCPYIPNKEAGKNDFEETLRATAAENCSVFPVSVVFDEPYIEIPNGIVSEELGQGDIVKIDLRFLYANTLRSMSVENLNILLNLLGQKRAKIHWHNIGRFHHSHKLEVNAAAALALKVGIEKQFPVLASMLATAPEQIIPLFDGKLAVLADFHFVTDALLQMTKNINDVNLMIMAKANAKLIHYYMRFWSGKKVETLRPLLARLVMKMTTTMNEAEDFKLDIRQRGILLGSLFAGSLYYAREITKRDERRLFIINTTSNLTWAATAFLGAIPIAGNIIAAMGGIISISVVSAAAIYAKHHPKDGVPSIKEVEGIMEMNLLSSFAKDDGAKALQVLTLKSWMTATIHANGFSD